MKILRKITLIMASLPLVVSQVSAMESIYNLKIFKLPTDPNMESTTSKISGYDYYKHYVLSKTKVRCAKCNKLLITDSDIEHEKRVMMYAVVNPKNKDDLKVMCPECASEDYKQQVIKLVFKALPENGKSFTQSNLKVLGVYNEIDRLPKWWPKVLIAGRVDIGQGNLSAFRCVVGLNNIDEKCLKLNREMTDRGRRALEICHEYGIDKSLSDSSVDVCLFS